MNDDLRLHDLSVEKIKWKIAVIINLLIILLGGINTIFNYLNTSNITSISFIGMIPSIVILPIVYYKMTKYYMEVILTLLLIFSTIVAYFANSAYSFVVVIIIIIFAALYNLQKYVNFVFVFSISFIIIMLIQGRFTFYQTIPDSTNIALVNNIQVLLPLLILSYLLSIGIKKVYIHTIEFQQSQYSKLLEDQELILSQVQIDTLKVISGGVSHDLNNILMVMQSNIDILKLSTHIDDESKENLQEIENAIDRASNLSKQMLSLVRKQEIDKVEIINLTSLIQETTEFILKGSQNNVFIENQQVYMIEGNYAKISQVVQNLVMNADQAMLDSGLITISMDKKIINGTTLDMKDLPPGEYVEVHISDEGTGISEEFRDKIFDLFYTSKEHGSGIGLTVSRMSIEEHGGILRYANLPNGGSDFYFILPLSNKPSIVDDDYNLIDVPITYSRVVVYEDDKRILVMLEFMLKHLGLEVLSFSDSHSLLAELEKLNKDNIDVDIFILDLTLPGDLSGDQLMKKLKVKFPNSYYIASSGYSSKLFDEKYSDIGFDFYLNKPYSIEDLKSALNRGRISPLP